MGRRRARHRRARGPVLGVLAVTALLAGACRGGSDPVDPASLPRFDATVVGRAVDLDFVAAPDGFPRFDDGNGHGTPEPGVGYRLGIRENESVVSATAPVELPADQVVEAHFDTTNSPLDAAVGVVCRAKSNDTYYRLGAGNDGTYAIARVDDGASTILTGGGKWIKDRRLPSGPGGYDITASCRGDLLTLTVNGTPIAEVHDTGLTGRGRAGVFVETFAEGGSTVSVQKFVARAFPSRDAVTDELVTAWEAFVRRQTASSACTLVDTARIRAPGAPRFAARCGRTLTLAYADGAQATEAFDRILARADTDLDQIEQPPNCRKRTGVAGPLYGAGRVACLDLGDATAVVWLNEPNGLVGLARVDDDDRAGWRGYGPAWPPFVLRS